MASDELEELRETAENLKSRVANGADMANLANSPAGKMFLGVLSDRYSDIVRGAVRESESYRLACKSIEEIFSLMGRAISVGEEAKRELERIGRPDNLEDY